MPETPGKRQRRAVKARRREEKDERRAARKALRQDPTSGAGGDGADGAQPTEDGQADEDGPVVDLGETESHVEQPPRSGEVL
jgi:hypothetical protein